MSVHERYVGQVDGPPSVAAGRTAGKQATAPPALGGMAVPERSAPSPTRRPLAPARTLRGRLSLVLYWRRVVAPKPSRPLLGPEC